MRSLVATGLLAVATCGCTYFGSTPLRSSEAGFERPRLSHAALVRKADAACGRRSRALAALPRPRTNAQARGFFSRVAAVERAEVEALAALRPPKRDELKYARLVAASFELAEIAKRFHLAVRRGDEHERRRALAAAERASAAYDRAARRLGVACRQS
jgi:hypothetical protein